MYSEEHKNYLKEIKKRNFFVRLTQVSIVLLLVITWQILADKHIINTFITSSPKEVVKTIINLHMSNNLYNHIWVTIYETLISFVLGTLIGIIIEIGRAHV